MEPQFNITNILNNLTEEWPAQVSSDLISGKKSEWLGERCLGVAHHALSLQEAIEKITTLLKSSALLVQNPESGEKVSELFRKLRQVGSGSDQESLTKLNAVCDELCFPLHCAVKEGDLERVKVLIKEHQLLTTRDFNYKTPLGIAIEEKQAGIVRWLCQNGADQMGAIQGSLPRKITAENFKKTKEILEMLVSEKFEAKNEWNCSVHPECLLGSEISLEDKRTIVILFNQLGITRGNDFSIFLFKCLNSTDYELFKIFVVYGGADTACLKSVNDKEDTQKTLLQELVMHFLITDPSIVKGMIEFLIEKAKTPITSHDISWAFPIVPTEVLQYLAEHFQGVFTADEFDLLIKESFYKPDLTKLALLIKMGKLKPDTSTMAIAIEHKNPGLLKFLLDQGIKPQQWQHFWDKALQGGNLAILKILSAVNPEKSLIDRLINLDTLDELQIQHYFLNSDLKDVKELIAAIREKVGHSPQKQKQLEMLDRVEKGFYDWGSLICRLPDPAHLGEMTRSYNAANKAPFTNSQIEFGNFFHHLITETLALPESRTMPLEEILHGWAKKRAEFARNRGAANGDDYETFRKSKQNFYTPSTNIGFYHFPLRYGLAMPIINDLMQTCAVSKDLGFTINTKDSYWANYKLAYPQGNNLVDLTHVSVSWGVESKKDTKFEWEHTDNSNIPKLLPELESLHKRIMAFPLDKNNPEKMKEFHELAAEGFWLGCNLMMTVRGNSQYFLMWLNFIRRHHDLKPLIPKLETPLIDCIAISQPLNIFKERFMSYFEAA